MGLARIRRLLTARRLRRAAFAIVAIVLAPWVFLFTIAAFTPLPAELAAGAAPSTSVELRDRHGVVLRELRADDGVRARWVPLAELGELAPRAVIAAEDRRFAHHLGVDPVAIARAFGQLVAHRRVVSGASTLTQQLARNVVPRRRGLWGKIREAALAVRIEWSLDKRAIVEQYLNRVSFGPGLRGIEAASRYYFDKPTRDLSLAEAAALSGIPRGPALYDPHKGTERLQRRRDRVLDRMQAAGLASAADIARAKAEPIALAKVGAGLGAPHLVRALMSGALDPALGPLKDRTSVLTLTIDRGLQREVEVLAQQAVRALSARHVSAASVVVIDNASGELLAYVGSPDIGDTAHLGHNDGVLALRQPGSTLKPFVYELAMEQLGFTAATVLPDVEIELPTRDGSFHPNNYDGRFHGPVRLREALANSYNVPAVWTADAIGPSRVLSRLRAVGLGSLREEADFYGAAIALGDGEVRLLDLTNAYAMLARGGELLPVAAVKEAIGKDGRPITLPARARAWVMDAADAFVITDILADKAARVGSFGEGNALELPFPVAAKTGTSKGFRDNWTVGYTPEVTVGVWVGNFDGTPMEGVSGVTGAGPLFHDAMLAAARTVAARADHARGFTRPDGIEEVEVCPLSGAVPTSACPHRRREVVAVRGGRSLPTAECAMHARVRVDPRNDLLAGRRCPLAEERVFERFEARFTAWARSAGRPIAPERYSPLCPPAPGEIAPAPDPRERLRVAFPWDMARFSIDPGASAKQEIRLRADVPAGVSEVRFILDGKPRVVKAPFTVLWPLVPGEHRLRVEADGIGADEITFDVE